MQDPRPWTDNRQSTHAHWLPLCQTWLCFWRKKNAELCCRISPKEETMARLADYFTVVGYDPDKAGKLRCLWVEECCDLFRPLATTTARLLLLCFKRLINGFHFLWRVIINGIKRECVSVLQLTLVVCVYELSSWYLSKCEVKRKLARMVWSFCYMHVQHRSSECFHNSIPYNVFLFDIWVF